MTARRERVVDHCLTLRRLLVRLLLARHQPRCALGLMMVGCVYFVVDMLSFINGLACSLDGKLATCVP